MTTRERALGVLRYETVDRLPLLHFGFWKETFEKWRREGRLTDEELAGFGDGRPGQEAVARRLGFDAGWGACHGADAGLRPGFGQSVVRELPDGSRHLRNHDGVTVLQFPGAISIPAEIEHLLVDRASWHEHYEWRLRWDPERVEGAGVLTDAGWLPFGRGGLAWLARPEPRALPLGIFGGSMIGRLRDICGVEGLSYLLADDEPLVDEMLERMHELARRGLEGMLGRGWRPDYGHFWEDICFRGGPLVSPATFRAKCGPVYRACVEVLARHGIDLVSVDCDGCIDALVPIWLECGVNVMFPIEVGTWHASLAPWREKYGRAVRGIGGMDKRVFARDRAAVDAEVERLRPLVELGGYLPCPDHRIAPDAEWDLVCHYCERMRAVFG